MYDELLKYNSEDDILSISYIQDVLNMIEKKNREEILKHLHPYSVWQSKEGTWFTKLPDAERGLILKKRKNKKDLEDVIIQFWKEKAENPTLQEVFQEWISTKLEYKEITKGSADRYETDFERFFVASGFAEKHIKQIDEDCIEDFIRTQIAKHDLTMKSYSGLRILIRGMFIYAKKKKWTNISISSFFGDFYVSRNAFRKSIKEAENEVFSEDEIPVISDYLKSHITIWNLGILLALQTGLRVGELSTLKKTDFQDGLLKIRRTEVRQKDSNGKNTLIVREFTKTESGMRNVILSDSGIETMKLIISLNPDGEFLFENADGKRIRGNTFNKHLDCVLKTLGLRHRSIHKARKTYGTMLIDAGCDDSLVMNQLGHSCIDTSRKYYYFSNKTKQHQIEQIKNAVSI